MNGQRRAFLTIAGVVLLLAAAAAAEQSKPAVPPPAQTTARPSDEGTTPGKLVAPVRGQAELGFTNPVSKRVGNMIVTTIKVKNLSNGAIAGLKVDEFWYDKKGDPVTGSQPFRYRKPLQPGEVIDSRTEGADRSAHGPEPVQVRTRQRHDQDDETAEALRASVIRMIGHRQMLRQAVMSSALMKSIPNAPTSGTTR